MKHTRLLEGTKYEIYSLNNIKRKNTNYEHNAQLYRGQRN